MIGNIALRQKEAPSKALLDLDERIHALEELRVEEVCDIAFFGMS